MGGRKGIKRVFIPLVKNDFIYEVLSFFLCIGILYFSHQGILMLALDCDTPLMPVISNSMQHHSESWKVPYEQMGYDPSQFPFQGGFERGDLLVIKGVDSPSEISVGDVVVYQRVPGTIPVVHRVLSKSEDGQIIILKGDANSSPDPSISFEMVRGKVILAIPNLGWFSISVWKYRWLCTKISP